LKKNEIESNQTIIDKAGNKIWNFFSSLKLIITVFLTLAVVSIIGTVIEQGKPPDFYTKEYGEKIAHYVLSIGFHDMYHSWWFLILLALLAANIIVCTIDRFPQKWETAIEKKYGAEPRFIKNLANSAHFTVSGDVHDIKIKVAERLKKKRYKIINADAADGASIYAWKGVIGRFGSDVTHVSLILILVGAIIGNFWGFRGYVSINENDAVNAPQADFKVRLDRFWIDYYNTGEVKQYNSLLTVIDNNKEILTKQIYVNEPLIYKGTWFYQSNYGVAYDRIREAQLILKNKKENKQIGEPFKVKWYEPFKIPGTNLTVNLVGFISDFGFDEKTKQIYARSLEHNNPAIAVVIYDGDKPISDSWLFLNYPDVFATIPNSDYNLTFMGYSGLYYTGLSVNNDPGTNIVWIGSILMTVGFIFAFMIFHKRIWVNIKRGENGVDIYMGGMINKNKILFEREFSELVESLKAKWEVGK